jgi:hypothetical protein
MRKPKWRALRDRCLLCRRKAINGTLACARHQKTKVNLTFKALPWIIEPEAILCSPSRSSSASSAR